MPAPCVTFSPFTTTASARSFIIAGFVDTARGRIRTQVTQSIRFANRQEFDITDTRYLQDIHQETTIASSPGPVRAFARNAFTPSKSSRRRFVSGR